VILTAVALAGSHAPPPQQQPTFRAGVRTVPVYVTVSDNAGSFILDLTQQDFEVKDNGKVQTITQFTTAAQPLSTLLLLDGSSSMWSSLNTVFAGANAFIVRMLPGDRTAIASFADRFQMRQPFTSDRDALLGHLADQFNIRLGLETRLWDGLIEATLATSKEDGRRVVLVLSDGKNWVDPRSSSASQNQAIGVAVSGDVMIYGISVWTSWDGRDEAPDNALSRVADHTGGGAIELRQWDEINATFGRVSKELHQQYVLGFTPSVLDGKTHRIDVRVKKPDLKVRARKSYLAAETPKAP
jgi:Ca-activated chloride channel family protein